MAAPRPLVDVIAGALHLSRIHGVDVDPARIRQWATRGKVTRHGRRGRHTRYDLEELEQVAAKLLAPRP